MKNLSIFFLLAALIGVFAGCESEPAAVADATNTPTPTKLQQVSASAPVEKPSDFGEEPGSADEGVTAGNKEPAKPKPIYVRPRNRIRGGGVKDLVFDDLAFEIEADADFKDDMLTKDIKKLDGQPIILRGFILDASVFTQTGIKEFVLIRDNQECCFGPGAKICHNVWVNMDKGQTANFSFRPVEVHGKFSIRLYRGPHDGKVYSVYHLQASKVKGV